MISLSIAERKLPPEKGKLATAKGVSSLGQEPIVISF